MKNFKHFNRNLKAISPIFATLILIAIAVIAGVVVYMFTSGTLSSMTGGGTAGQEKVAVQAASSDGSDVVSVMYQSTGGPLPTVTSIIIKDSTGNVVGTETTLAGDKAATVAGALYTVTGSGIPLTANVPYTATLVTSAGGSFVSPSFIGE